VKENKKIDSGEGLQRSVSLGEPIQLMMAGRFPCGEIDSWQRTMAYCLPSLSELALKLSPWVFHGERVSGPKRYKRRLNMMLR